MMMIVKNILGWYHSLDAAAQWKLMKNVIVALGVVLLPVLVAIRLYWTNGLITQVGATDKAVLHGRIPEKQVTKLTYK